jgi:tRNA A37 threonylcarbamoyladenosine modification protein TsaB
VKGWAEIYQKPIAGVSVLLAVAAQSKVKAGAVAPFMDARRGQVFGALYQSTGGERPSWRLLGEEALLSAEEFLARVRSKCGAEVSPLVSSTPEALEAGLVAALLPGSQIEAVSKVLAPVVGRLGYEQALSGELQNALNLDANYIRRSDAEVFWKGA